MDLQWLLHGGPRKNRGAHRDQTTLARGTGRNLSETLGMSLSIDPDEGVAIAEASTSGEVLKPGHP
jgi:hypothetical protein